MKKFRQNLIGVSALAAVGLLLTACEDPASKARAQVQEDLTAAADSFQNVVLSHTGVLDEAGRTKLRSLLGGLNSAGTNTHAGAGQKASAQLLAADIHRLLADAQLAEIDALRSQQRHQRMAVESMITGAVRLNVIATALAQGTVDEQIAMLTQQRTAAEAALRQEQQHIAQVESPLTQLESKISDARSQVSTLRTQENQLRRQASEMGYSKGFQTYEEAIAVRQQADKIETASSYDELERDFEFRPTREMHELRIAQIEAAIESIDLAVEELRQNADSAQSMSSKTRQDLDALLQRINSEVTAMSARLNDEIAPLVDSAAQDLSNAASKAQQAGGANQGGNSAKLTAAAANTTLGQLHANLAFEHEQHATLLKQLMDSNLPGTSGKYSAQISSAEQAKSQAVEQAVAALTDASAAYDRVTGGNSAAAVAGLKHAVESTIASLTGAAAPEAPAMDSGSGMSGDDSMGAASTGMSSGGQGAESPEALAAILASMNTVSSSLAMFDYLIPLEHVNFKSPAERNMAEAMIAMVNAMRNFESALTQQFGAEGAQALAALAKDGPAQAVSSASVASTNGDRATLSVTFTSGETKDIKISQIDGLWYVGTPEEFTGGLDDSASQMQGNQGMGEFPVQMLNTMTQTVNTVTGRVNAGEFATPQEAADAVEQALQNAMGGAMPGM